MTGSPGQPNQGNGCSTLTAGLPFPAVNPRHTAIVPIYPIHLAKIAKSCAPLSEGRLNHPLYRAMKHLYLPRLEGMTAAGGMNAT